MRKKILVTVITYPQPSARHVETVCTAGFTEEGDFVRVYPIRMRMLDGGMLHKWNWYEMDVEKRPGEDFRPESLHASSPPDATSLGFIRADPSDGWEERRERTIGRTKAYTSMDELLSASDPTKPGFISLAVFRPGRIKGLTVRKWDSEKRRMVREKKDRILAATRTDGDPAASEFDVPEYWEMADTIPYQFNCEFTDGTGKVWSLMVEDWEIYSIFRRYLREYGPFTATHMLRKRFAVDFQGKDIYLFLGTRLRDQRLHRPEPYSIIGFFYPPGPQSNDRILSYHRERPQGTHGNQA